jgi:hypothetical protein
MITSLLAAKNSPLLPTACVLSCWQACSITQTGSHWGLTETRGAYIRVNKEENKILCISVAPLSISFTNTPPPSGSHYDTTKDPQSRRMTSRREMSACWQPTRVTSVFFDLGPRAHCRLARAATRFQLSLEHLFHHSLLCPLTHPHPHPQQKN